MKTIFPTVVEPFTQCLKKSVIRITTTLFGHLRTDMNAQSWIETAPTHKYSSTINQLASPISVKAAQSTGFGLKCSFLLKLAAREKWVVPTIPLTMLNLL
ncbi:hypothetical protein NIES2101_22860 [Calothrix sp. HK-06]|nr:hypothetical protein NIES2101_22860 [Calothrix sp. HK-06]